MDLNKILGTLQDLFSACRIEQIEDYLEENIRQAAILGDTDTAITLMNEMIGYCRDTGKFEKALYYCEQVLLLMEQLGMKGSIPYATTLQNVANAYRAMGRLRESKVQYETVQRLYEGKIPRDDMLYASLYNNFSLLYQELGDYASACRYLEKALQIVLTKNDKQIEAAVTYSNLAASQLQLGEVEKAIENLKRAFSIFDLSEEKDFHYSGAVAAMAQAQYLMGNLEEASRYYQIALREVKKHTGESKSYEIILQNLNSIEEMMKHSPTVVKQYHKGLDLCRDFYLEYGAPMIHTLFPEYEDGIAVGLAGEGSECFGFDDEVSRDHDFGPGFCMWLTESLYEEIGEKLQAAYDSLPSSYMGIRRITTAKAGKRVGVFRIKDFYEKLIGLPDVPKSNHQWLFLEDYQLAAATNGQVFRDDLGEFTRIRKELLKHYPEEVRVQKIAREAALMAQTGQYNYGRMYGRGEKVTAFIALSEFMKHTMSMVYLLNRRYAPFYKWMHKGMDSLPILPEIMDILNAIVDMQIGDERISQTIEIIVALIIAEMKKQSLTFGEDNYLDEHTDRILKSIPKKENQKDTFKRALVDELVRLEWNAFDKVENIGGRAGCQDDWNTFSIMRKSQYYTWTAEMLKSYIHDFHVANDKGWNLIMEKYARMMKTNDPLEYLKIENILPIIPAKKQEIIEEIIKIQVNWMEEFAAKYPKAAGCARSIRTSSDTLENTSYETYLRGELSTYSDETLDLYGRNIAKLLKEGKNLAQMIISNTAFLYGYTSLDEMEEKL